MLVDFNEGASAVFAERSDVSAERRLVGRGDHRPPPAAAARAGRARAQLHRLGAHGAALPSDDDRSRLRRRDREPLLRRGRRHRVGRALVLGERIEVGRRPAAVSAAAGRRKCCRCRFSCASATTIAIGSRAPSASASYDCYVVRFDPVRERAVAVSRDRVDRAQDVRAREGVRRADGPLRAGRLQRGDPDATLPVASIGNRPIFLFTGLTARQIILIAGRNILVEKIVAFERFPRQRSRLRRGARERAREATASCTGKPTRVCGTTSSRGTNGSSASARREPHARWRWASRSIRRTRSRCRSSASTT